MGIEREHIGRRKVHPEVGERVCAREGCEVVFTPSAASAAHGVGRYHSRRCHALDEWSRGTAKCRAWLYRAPTSGRARQRWGGRWNATKPPALGGRPRGRPAAELTDDQRNEIQILAARGWGRRTIANQTGASERAVRNELTR
jgi:hypothetical protein